MDSCALRQTSINRDIVNIYFLPPSLTAYHLYQIAVHEIGHALGLLHSKDRRSIMWPMYRYWTENRLPSDDVSAIQSLYGMYHCQRVK